MPPDYGFDDIIKRGPILDGFRDCLEEAGQRVQIHGSGTIAVTHPGWDSQVEILDTGEIVVNVFKYANGDDRITHVFRLEDPNSVDKVCQALNRGPWWKTSDTKS